MSSEEERRIDYTELSRAGAASMTLLLAIFVAQLVFVSLSGFGDGEEVTLERLQQSPGIMFGIVLVNSAVTGLMAFLFARGALVQLLSRWRLGVRGLVFGTIAAIFAGQAVGYLVALVQASASESNALIAEGLIRSENGAFFLAAFGIALAAPVAEELFFRGFLLESLNRSVGRGLALLFSATLFGLIHLDPVQSFSATAIGLVLGILAMAGKSLWPAIVAHAVNNAVFLGLVRVAPEELTRESALPLWANLLGVIICTTVAVGALVLAVGRTKLADLFEAEPEPGFGVSSLSARR